MKFEESAIIAIFLILASCNSKQENTTTADGKTVFETSEKAFVKITEKDGKFNYEKSETRFDVIELIGKEPQKILLSITQKENRELAQDENTKKQFLVSVKSMGDKNIDWTKNFEGAAIDYSEKVLSVPAVLGENEEETFSYFNIRNGEKIMDFTYGILKAMIPNTSDRRYFSYLAKDNSLKAEVKGDGVISYASNKKLLQQFSITSKGKIAIPNYTPDIQVLTMREAGNQLMPDGKTIFLLKLNQDYTAESVTGFAFQVTYFSEDGQTEYKLIFPVEDDKIDLKNAIFDRTLFEVKEL